MEFTLLIKKINGTLTQEEAIAFEAWYEESEAHRNYFKTLKAHYNDDALQVDTEEAYEQLRNKLRSGRRRWNWTVAAAVMAGVLISATLWWSGRDTERPAGISVLGQPVQITSGTNKAILKKSDGTRIALQKGQNYEDNRLTSNGESINYKKADDRENSLAYNTLEVPRGGVFSLTLADGTAVWLNSASAIKYPVSFANAPSREVELLYGEAYFDVAPAMANRGKDFKVISRDQTIQVLGTGFNVKAYKEESDITTTLAEGKVVLKTPTTDNRLVPGKQAVYDTRADKVAISNVNVYDEISWKDGLFSFNDKPLKEILTVLSRWYDVDFSIENSEAAKTRFNGIFNKKQNLDQILLIIEKTNEAKFETVGKAIILK